MKVVFAGTPEFAAISLEALLDARHEIPLVLTQPDRPAGRGLKPHPSAVKQLALTRGLALRQPATLDPAAIAEVSAARPEAIVVAAYGRLIPPALLALPPRGCLNVHASLLPRWRGAAPIQRALLAGDTHTGITIMQMDAGLDTGSMLIQEALPILPDDTAGTLHDKLAALGARLIVSALALPPHPQPQDATRATYARRIGKEETEIDWHRPAEEIERQVRAYEPTPGAQTRFDGKTLKIRRARVEPGVSAPPGAVHATGLDGIVVACGRDGLRVMELQRAGGRRLTAGEFLAGSRLAAGARLGAENA
jgi:methionyl-tRNA formyltransferase